MQQSNRQESKSREDRKMVVGAEECGAGAGEDLEEEKGDNTRTTNDDDDRQHTTIKHNMLEEGERWRRWWRR
jgi:hypothetical protein